MTKLIKMTSFTAEDILTESVKTLMEDEVCIDTAMKNVIAKVYALYSTQDRNTSFSRNDNSQVVYKDIMSCARFILQAFNNHTLRSYEEWTEDNPQREDTSADSRLKELTNYKAAHYLKSKLEGKKLSKSLGRRYLLATGLWHSYVLPAAQEKSTSSGVEQDVFTYFSTEFGLSLQGDLL